MYIAWKSTISVEVHGTLGMLYGTFIIYHTVVQEIGRIIIPHVTAVRASPLVLKSLTHYIGTNTTKILVEVS